MYLIAKFEKKIKAISDISTKFTETEISLIFDDDILGFLSSHKEYKTRNVIKTTFQTNDIIGIEIYLI